MCNASHSPECSPELIARIPDVLSEVGCDVVAPLTECVVEREGTAWKTFSCSRREARACVSVCTRQGDPRRYVVASMDLRRVVTFWRWRADFRLTRDIARAMENAGAVEVTD